MIPRTALLVIPLLLLSGCADSCELPDLLRTVDGDAPSAGGPGFHALTIRVVDPLGSPVAADVITIWADNEQPGGLPESLKVMALGLRAGPDGTVQAHVPDDRTLAVVADPAGYTREWRFDVAKGTDELTLVTVPREHSHIINQTFHFPLPTIPPTSGEHVAPGLWHNDSAISKVYAERLIHLKVALTWENAPLHAADFGFKVGDGERTSSTNDMGTDLGPQQESRTWDKERLKELEWLRDGDLRLSLYHDTPVVAHEPLETRFVVDGTFDNVAFDTTVCDKYAGHDAEFFKAPLTPDGAEDTQGERITPGLPAFLVGAGLLAMAMWRRGRSGRP